MSASNQRPEDVGRPLTPEELALAIHRDEARNHMPGWNQHDPHTKRAMAFMASLSRLKAWLSERGAEVQSPTNEYEVLRYRATGKSAPSGKLGSHVVYRKANGRITFTGDTSYHFSLFVSGRTDVVLGLPPAPEGEKPKRRKTPRARISWTARTRDILLKRDGSDCWFCHKPLGDDVTIEHMLAQHLGGTDHIDNLVLAHRECNQRAGHKTPEEKEAIREYYRGGLNSHVPHWIDPPRRSRKKST